MIREMNNQSKLEKLRKNKDKSFTLKIDEDKPIDFALTIQYFKDN